MPGRLLLDTAEQTPTEWRAVSVMPVAVARSFFFFFDKYTEEERLTLLSGGFERKEGLTIDYVTLRRAKKRGEKNERKAD